MFLTLNQKMQSVEWKKEENIPSYAHFYDV